MTRSLPRAVLVLAILAAIVASLWCGSGSSCCAAADPVRHHRTSVVRVERCAAAGVRSLVNR